MPFAVPDHVDGGQEEPVAAGVRCPDAGPQECRMSEHELGGDAALGHQPPVAVDVGEDEVEQGDPLGHCRFEG